MSTPELFNGFTVQGLYNDQTGDALYGVNGTAAPASSIVISGIDDSGTIRPLPIGKIGNPVPATYYGLYIAGKDTASGDFTPLSFTSGNLNVNASITPPSDSVTSGTLNTTPQALVVGTSGTSALMLQLAITTLTAGDSINFQVSLDGTTWQNAQLFPVPTIGGQEGSPSVSSIAGPLSATTLNYTLPVGGIQKFRVSTSGTWTTSSVAVTETAGQGQYGVFNYSDNQANFLATTYQGGAWSVSVSGTASINLTEVGGAAVTLGQKISAASVPVVLASDQSAIPVSQNSTWNVGVTGTVAVTQSTSPWVISGTVTTTPPANASTNITEWNTVAVGSPSAFGVAPTGNVIGVNSSLFASVSGTQTALTGTGTSLNVNITGTTGGTLSVAGTLTNNNAAPAATNIGALGYIATATPETYTAGDQVLATTSLGGAVRVVPVDEANASSLSYFGTDSGNAYTAVTTAFTPVIAFQTSSASFIYLLRILQVFTSGTVCEFQLLKNPTVTGGAFAAAGGHMSTNLTATSYSAGTLVMSGYAGSQPFLAQQMLDAMAAGTPGDTFAIQARSFTGNGSVVASIRWSEQSAAL